MALEWHEMATKSKKKNYDDDDHDDDHDDDVEDGSWLLQAKKKVGSAVFPHDCDDVIADYEYDDF